MKLVYPVIFTEDPAGGYMAYVPDLDSKLKIVFYSLSSLIRNLTF